MPEGVGYASANVTAGTGFELNYVENKVFAYSGTIGVTGTTDPDTMLEFVTGSKTIEGIVQFQSVESGGNDLNFALLLNGLTIATQSINSAKEFYHGPIHVVIPPYTNVKCTGLNIDASTARDSTATFTGSIV